MSCPSLFYSSLWSLASTGSLLLLPLKFSGSSVSSHSVMLIPIHTFESVDDSLWGYCSPCLQEPIIKQNCSRWCESVITRQETLYISFTDSLNGLLLTTSNTCNWLFIPLVWSQGHHLSQLFEFWQTQAYFHEKHSKPTYSTFYSVPVYSTPSITSNFLVSMHDYATWHCLLIYHVMF